MKRERMKAALRTKAVKKWQRAKDIERTDFELNAFVTGFNMGWKSRRKFVRKRAKKRSGDGEG